MNANTQQSFVQFVSFFYSVEKMNSTDNGNNIIVNVQALQQGINKSTLCKECIESKIEAKFLDVLKYADKVRDEFASKVEKLLLRTKKEKNVLPTKQAVSRKYSTKPNES